jgi:hypothetical protein
MTITKRALPRRTILRGLGATVALPLLDAMVPAATALAQTPARPIHRFQAIYAPNGMAMPFWTPAAEGPGFELTPILTPLAPFKDKLLVLSGLRSSWTYVHAGASASFLTGTASGGENETDVLASTSIDQLLARELGKETQLGSLEVSMDKAANAGQCTAGLSCAYTQTISWRSPTMPLPMENNPRAVFERLFGDSGSAAPEARRARRLQKQSILDSVNDKLAHLKLAVGAPDRVKIDEYTEAVRDVERRIQKAEQQHDVDPTFVEQPQGPPRVFEDHLRLMFDLQLLALQTDLTRVVTFMLGREQSTRSYTQVGVPDAHHSLSHHEDDPDRVELMSRINTYHVELVSGYLARLQATADGDGSLLDHMTVLYGAGISNSTRHSGRNLPLLLVGGGAGRLKGGRHLRYTGDTTNANLLLTLLDKLDMPLDQLGNSTGRLQIDTLAGV